MNSAKHICLCVLLSAVLPAFAFLKPSDSRDGVTAYFVGLDEQAPIGAALKPNDPRGVACAKRDASAPFEIRLDIANTTDAPVSGDLRIWLNDDWEVAAEAARSDKGAQVPSPDAQAPSPDAQALSCAIPPHSTNSFFATAIPRPGRVLPALYPVHATFAFPGGDSLHPIAVFEAVAAEAARSDKSAQAPSPDAQALPCAILRLALLPGSSFSQLPGAAPTPISEARETGSFFNRGWFAADGDLRFGFFSQPPWRTGGGFDWRDIPLALPKAVPLTLRLSTAIRPSLRAGEGRSDGADYKVFVVEEDGRATEVYSALVKSQAWTEGEADLTPWAGRNVTIRLWNGCGPANDPNYDRCLWGDVGVFGGAPAENGAAKAARSDKEGQGDAALSRASPPTRPEAASPGGSGAEPPAVWRFPLSVRGESWTATFTPGPCGLIDGTLSFSDGERALSFTGFTCAIDDITVGAGPLDARCTGFSLEEGSVAAGAPSPAILHTIDLRDGRTVAARATLFAEGPALRIRWDMPGAVRDDRGSPRFTRLGVGPASLPAARAYMSFGNVLEEPRSFELTGGLFRNMASHAGADYLNGASLCQAADALPDRVLCRSASNVFAVETSHDATLSFVPSARGAFAAARAWRDVAGFRRSSGWREAAVRPCLDQWGGPKGGFAKATKALDRLARYGVTNALYCRHVWQRWGFDNRLPDIWPLGNKQPHGSEKVFLGLVGTARRHGHLFVPHDNYIDHYPDSSGFSYDDACFDESGAPVKAWFNYHVSAQSYRWAPGAYLDALRANAAALKEGFAPEGVFLDVFSNMAPFDWHDRAGRYHTCRETAAAWGEAFDEYRRILGEGAVTVGEGGHDALVGHLDAGQPDHFTPERWMDRSAYAESERVPWHDIVTHGSFVLQGGGLGWRYASNSPERGADTATKGYTSDSYLCTTVIGGRTPFSEFDPFDPDYYIHAVDTFWLLAPVCRDLALSEFEAFEFDGSIHRQRATFAGGEGGGGTVWVNREGVWRLPSGLSLPPDGFYAETRTARAGIVALAGRRCAFSESGGSVFVDGRPDRHDGTGPADTANAGALADFSQVLCPDAQALPCAIKTDGAFRLERDGANALVLTPLPGSAPFRVEIDLSANRRVAAGAPSPAVDQRVVAGAPSPAVSAVPSVEPIEPSPGAAPPDGKQEGGVLSLSLDSHAFAYRVVF